MPQKLNTMIKKSLALVAIFCSLNLFAQDDLIKKVINNASITTNFVFTDVVDVQCPSVKNQGKAGTCWSFSGNSFIESEMMRMGKQPVELSPIYTARMVYLSKAKTYILMNGNSGLGDGGETHDVINMYKKFGAMPQMAYKHENYGNGSVKSSDFQGNFKKILDNYISKPDSLKNGAWTKEIAGYLDEKLGKLPETFIYNGKSYTAKTFSKEVVGIDPANYMEFSSFKDNPYYEQMVLPFSDNWSYERVYNVPMVELTDIIDNALEKGFTVAWSTDVTEPYFSWRNGVAEVPDMDLNKITAEQKKTLFDKPLKEKQITEDLRLQGIYNQTTTDDHAMQIVGMAKDQNGKPYYKVKNSWGDSNDYKGYLYVTKAFVQLKTTGILLHKDGVPKATAKKLKS
jgi:bleomycin hydrolase